MQFSLDVVTDGSEHTSSTVFLTVSRTIVAVNAKPEDAPDTRTGTGIRVNTEIDLDQDTVLARYALCGVSTLTSRLAADQRFKLSPVRAIFCPSTTRATTLTQPGTSTLSANIPHITGIPSLLLSLSNYSLNGKLHVVGGSGIDDYMDKIVDITLNRRKYPEVITCIVPFESESAEIWWKVYEDEYIHVHARYFRQILGENSRTEADTETDSGTSTKNGNSENEETDDGSGGESSECSTSDEDSCESGKMNDSDECDEDENRKSTRKADIVYIITIIRSRYTFAVFPPNLVSSEKDMLYPLPEEVANSSRCKGEGLSGSNGGTAALKKKAKPLRFILHINPHVEFSANSSGTCNINVHRKLQEATNRHLATVAVNKFMNNEAEYIDDGLLVRSLNQARLLHSYTPFAFSDPFFVKPNYSNDSVVSKTGKIDFVEETGGNLPKKQSSTNLVPFQRIRSFTSIIFISSQDRCIQTEQEDTKNDLLTICRKQQILAKLNKSKGSAEKMDEASPLHEMDDDERKCKILELEAFYSSECRGSEKKTETSLSVPEDDDEIDLSSDEDDPNEAQVTEDAEFNEENEVNKSDQNWKRRKYHHETDTTLSSHTNICFENQGLDKEVPHLLVLGTGCASPAPLRGSSGYAIFIPTSYLGAPSLALSVVMECGEGYLTMLGRHFSNVHDKDLSQEQMFERCVSHIRLIWISHSHLDHYGDLPNLIHEINRLRQGGIGMCTCYQIGRVRTNNRSSSLPNSLHSASPHLHRPICKRCARTCPPIVIAPPKVLKFLDASLQCKHGKIEEDIIYIGISNKDFDSSPFSQQIQRDVFDIELMNHGNRESPDANSTYKPIAFLKNIPVEHCPNAYACLLGLNVISKDQTQRLFSVSYSGDTRPSSNIIRACEDFTRSCNLNVSLLLHEATFDDDARGKEEAVRKRHSTVKEAMSIANKLRVDSVLLTHFSQRYPRLPPGNESQFISNGNEGNGLKMACAYDGMILPLKDGLRTMLPALGSLVATLISSHYPESKNDRQVRLD